MITSKSTIKTAMAGLLLLGTATAASADHSETVRFCVETYADDWSYLTAEVTGEAGRLTATVTQVNIDAFYDRVLAQVGVAERTAPGRELDVLYIGRNLKLSTGTTTDAGLLEMVLNGRRVRIPMTCDQ